MAPGAWAIVPLGPMRRMRPPCWWLSFQPPHFPRQVHHRNEGIYHAGWGLTKCRNEATSSFLSAANVCCSTGQQQLCIHSTGGRPTDQRSVLKVVWWNAHTQAPGPTSTACAVCCAACAPSPCPILELPVRTNVATRASLTATLQNYRTSIVGV